MQLLKSLYLTHFSQPAHDRPVFRWIRRLAAHRFLEFGLQRGVRAKRMIAMGRGRAGEVEYIGIDPFESRTVADGPGWSLRKAHHELKATGARIRLQPGDPTMVLTRIANSVQGIQVAVVATPTVDWLESAWQYLPRMLADEAVVLLARRSEANGPVTFSPLTKPEVEALAAKRTSRRAA